jgi:hypothetical protein
MLRDTQKNFLKNLLTLFICMLSVVPVITRADLTSYNKTDAIPPFSTLNWDDSHLLTKTQLLYRDYDWAEKKRSHAVLSISPFAQNADRGKTIQGRRCVLPFPFDNECGQPVVDTPLGDLTGRTGMIALMYNTNNVWPGGVTDPLIAFAKQPVLLAAYQEFFPSGIGLNDEANIDPHQLYAFFSFPLKYRKRGLRFDTAIEFYNFGLRMQGGFSTIRQVREDTIDLTGFEPEDGFVPVTPSLQNVTNIENFLMKKFDDIAEESGIGTCEDFINSSAEEFRFYLYWRQAFAINEDADTDWAKFLLIPYLEVGASVSPGLREDGYKFFSAPFGNNGHPSAGFTAGINFDFRETIEIGGEIGYTHFFERTYCRPVPNNEFQTNLYPFSTRVKVNPGDNWYFGARLAAYHFIDNLSMYFEWFVLDHHKDEIDLVCPDPAFVPGVLECISSFKTKLGNAGFNYDLSPNIGLGFLWQIPFSQRNYYRSSTIMAGLNVTF